MVTEPDEYNRGKIEERLASHDKHFEVINGSMKEVAENLAKLNLGIQRLIDSSAADRATVITTAQALKNADDARRDRGNAKWTPWQRLAAGIAAIAAFLTALFEILTHVKLCLFRRTRRTFTNS